VPHPQYGTAVQMNALSAAARRRTGAPACAWPASTTSTVKLADGTNVELRKPTLAFEGPVPDAVSLRAAQPIIGMGLLEAIPEADILARVRTSAPDADGVKGVANFVYDPESGAVRLGRFGWKASKATLRQQAAGAAAGHVGDLAGLPQPLRATPTRPVAPRPPRRKASAKPTCSRSRTTWRWSPCRPSAAWRAASRKASRRSTS
jgi:CxxC motif-containing protein (DUF1111 family)